MPKRLAKILTTLALLFGQPGVALSAPVIFVPEDAGTAWWARELTLRPITTRVAGVDVFAINEWMKSTRGLRDPEPICFVQAIGQDSIVSPKRLEQKEIDETLVEFPKSFQQDFISKSGRKFFVRVVAFETCGSKPRLGTGIIITDESEKFIQFIENEFLFTRLFKRDDGQINVFGCYYCGDLNELKFNPESNEFYLKWIGH